MPKSTNSFVAVHVDKTLPGMERLKRLLPAMAFSYFLNKRSDQDATKLAANWQYWEFSDTQHSPLVPQLLHFALFPNRDHL